MALLKIIKLTNNVWKHNTDIGGDFILTKFYAKNEFSKFLIVETYGSKRREYLINEIEVYNIGSGAETFVTFDSLFIRLKELGYTGYYEDGTFIFVPSDYISTDIDNQLQLGTDNKFFVPASGGGGGTSLRTESYEFVTGNQSLAASTLAHTPRYDVANSINNCLFITGNYDWITEAVTDGRMLGRNITFNQKAIRVTVNYALLSTDTTFRIIYYKPSPSGTTNVAIDNLNIYEKTIVNTGGVRQPLVIEIPSDVTMGAGGIISFAIFNNNVAVVPKGVTITVDTIEVI